LRLVKYAIYIELAGIKTAIGCHTFRATGITNYLDHDGTLEKAQQMASALATGWSHCQKSGFRRM
jgi:hypothetical protein